MRAYQLTLRILAVGIFVVSLIHVIFGVGSELFLGSGISDASVLDPNLDSQNRFYGAAFALFGIVWWLSSSDILECKKLLTASYLVFFVAGLTRILSVIVVGWPTVPILALTAIELLLPIVLYVWLVKLEDV